MKNILVFLIAAGSIMMQSCSSSIFLNSEIYPHTVVLDGDGKSKKIACPNAEEDYSFDKHVNAIMKGIQKSKKREILIYVHGGMKTISESVAETNEQIPIILNSSDYYPIYINWDSGFFSCYLEQLLFIRNGEYAPVFGPLSTPFYLLADLGESLFRLPVNLGKQMYEEITHKPMKKSDNLETMRAAHAFPVTISQNRFEENSPNPVPAVLSYLSNGVTKVTGTILVDAFGRRACKNMIRRTSQLFRPEEQFKPAGSRTIPGEIPQSNDGMAILMEKLMKITTSDSNYSITLIGHSLGTMVLNHIIENYSELPITNIIYMGSACSLEEFNSFIIPYLKRPDRKKSKFFNLCLHPELEFQEKMMAEMAPKGSLLEWLDNYLNDPEDFMEMTTGRYENIVRADLLIPMDIQDRIIIKVFGARENEPVAHGDFNDTRFLFWEEDFWQLKNPAEDDDNLMTFHAN